MSEMKMQSTMEQELSNVKTPTLTLDPEAQRMDPIFSQPAPTFGTNEVAESSYSAGAVEEASLSVEEKKQIEEFSRQINLSDIRQVNAYGTGAQKGIAQFSTSITTTVKTKEFGEVGDSLRELRAAINSTIVPEKKGLFGLFQKGKEKVTYLISNYESAETNIQKVEKDLKHHQQVLLKDVYVFDQMYEANLQYYKEITMYIIAGKKALERERATTLIQLLEKAERTQDQLDVQKYRDFEDICNRFEKRIYDLEASRLVSIQQAPQIRLLQNADQELADRLRADVLNTIPLWRNQMVLALGIEHNRRALDAQSTVNEMTNEMFRRNAETLKAGAIDVAKASERSIVDVETLKKCNADIIASINEVVKIHEEGSKRRSEAQVELAKLEEELKQALLEAGNR